MRGRCYDCLGSRLAGLDTGISSMRWIRRHPKLEEIHVTKATFLGEQDGEVEKEFKRRLLECFATTTTLHRAYLVRATFDDSPAIRIVLAMEANSGGHVVLRERAYKVFAKMFSSTVSLDILFPDQEQRRRISAVAKPFYER